MAIDLRGLVQNKKRLVLVAAVVVVIFAVLLAWSSSTRQALQDNSPSAAAINPASPLPSNPYAGWQTYTDTTEQFSFQYPPGWTLLASTSKDVKGAMRENITLNGTNSFVLKYALFKPGSDFFVACPSCNFAEASRFYISRNRSVFLVVNSQTADEQPYQSLGVSDYTSLAEQPNQAYPYFNSVKNAGYVVRWTGDFEPTTTGIPTPASSSYDSFIAQPEVATARLILHSINYR